MDSPKMLSGYDLVARGTTKIDRTLPEVGLKDVMPNGSWLENKQIQSALEARKHLIEVERIEKCGVLSQAVWREELMLAEVMQKAGGHWQYLGHNVGKQLYLKPEEALFLMEVNCLQLKYNDVIVSLQQAYSLLLRSNISLMHYKVYASLSRVGYKVYRHKDKKAIECAKKLNVTPYPSEETSQGAENEATEADKTKVIEENETDENMDEESAVDTSKSAEEIDKEEERDKIETRNQEDTVSSSEATASITQPPDDSTSTDITELNVTNTMDTGQDANQKTDSNIEMPSNNETVSLENPQEVTPSTSGKHIRISEISYYQNKLHSLEKRKVKPCDSKLLEKNFEIIPDFSKTTRVTMTAPEEQYIPRNVFLNNISYILNLENITVKSSSRRNSMTYSINEEASGNHVRRIRDTNPSNPAENWTPPQNTIFSVSNVHFRPRNFWRPPNNMIFLPFNFTFQRPFMPNVNFMARFRPPMRPPVFLQMNPRLVIHNQPNNENGTSPNRKRTRNRTKKTHFEAIKHLATRLRQLVESGNTQPQNIDALHRLIQTFNIRYHMRLRLTSTFEVYNDENIVETISLDDDEETSNKRVRSDSDNTYSENLNKLKQLAGKLKDMETKKISNSRQRRAFSSLLKRFNRSYDAELYLSNNFEVLDKRFITLDSSSDSDCVIDESPARYSGKKLKNPFNILKRLSEKKHLRTSTSNDNEGTSEKDEVKDNKYSKEITKNFDKNWLPSEEDFGRAEVVAKNLMNCYLMDNKREEFIFDFIKSQPFDFENWVDIKTSFLRSIQETTVMMQDGIQENSCNIDSLIGPEDGNDMRSVLKKLSIIQTNKEVDDDSSLTIHFDVYNRDVQNFRKSNRPKPHFRVICINETISPPTGRDIASLHSKYDDNVPIVFAIVGIGSISYLQINPIDLPVYISNSDLT
ncbi:uncharacterized protein LOC126368776 [Pectinophora gossypiella]|uniref:uncharacterized protein LOC126368776 n=1 Tax=Pectinophora gossypiella TaxID=13191 RepID=UPI00214F5B98|nr:uncharacterized protein LOC126368776 [Pectinophora gossypiella]